MKKVVPPVYHACIDYAVILVLLFGPSVFIYLSGVTAKCVSMFTGVLLALISFFTVYEGGIVRLLGIRFHLFLDLSIGVFLILAPWLFSFSEQTFLFHILVGIVLIGSVFLTRADIPSEFSTR